LCAATPVRQSIALFADSAMRATALNLPTCTRKEAFMTQHAKIRGEVCFRAGEGVLMPVPDGEVDIEVADDSVTLSWHDDEGNASTAAITRDEYERYRQEGKIRVADQ
jgi:hypothetical protein